MKMKRDGHIYVGAFFTKHFKIYTLIEESKNNKSFLSNTDRI